MRVDLHMHSTASDGQYTPTELVGKVKEAGIGLMALTDHDSVGGVEEARAAARAAGIRFIGGIELSIKHEAEMHVIGYGVDVHNQPLSDFCEQLVRDRDSRADRIIAYLAGEGVPVTREEVEAKAGSDLIGRPHFAQVMVEKGYVKNTQEAFDKYLASKAFAGIERPKPSAEEGFALLKDAGGTPVLAHPFSLKKTGKALDEEIGRLVSLGLAGIETYYSKHKPEQIAEYHALAQKYGLFETAGSDFHGEKVKPTIFLGKKDGGQEWLVDADEMLNLDLIMKLAA